MVSELLEMKKKKEIQRHTVHASWCWHELHPHVGILVKMLFIRLQCSARRPNALSRYYKFRRFLSARYLKCALGCALSWVEFSQWGGRLRVCLALQGNTGELGSQTFSIILNYHSSAQKLPLSNTCAYLWGEIQDGMSLKSAFCLTLDITVRSRELNCAHSRGFPSDFLFCKRGWCILLEFNKPLIDALQTSALFWLQRIGVLWRVCKNQPLTLKNQWIHGISV